MSTVFCISQHNIPPFFFASETISPFYLEKRLSLIRAMPFPLKLSVQMKCDEDPAWKQHKRCMTILRVLLSLLPAFFSRSTTYTQHVPRCVFLRNFIFVFGEYCVKLTFVILAQFVSYVRIGKTWNFRAIGEQLSVVVLYACKSDHRQWSSIRVKWFKFVDSIVSNKL